MSRRSTSRHPLGPRGLPLLLLPPVLLLTILLAGCMDDPGPSDDDADTRAAADAHAVTFLLSGFDAPAAGADHALRLTIGHIALYDTTRDEWIPLLTAPVDTTVRFDDTDTSPLDTYALLGGRYTQIELLVDNASVLTPSGTASATIDQAVCYTRIALDLTQPAPPTQLDLLVSGSAALRGDSDAWTVRPALVGSLTDHPDDEPVLEDVDCTAA